MLQPVGAGKVDPNTEESEGHLLGDVLFQDVINS